MKTSTNKEKEKEEKLVVLKEIRAVLRDLLKEVSELKKAALYNTESAVDFSLDEEMDLLDLEIKMEEPKGREKEFVFFYKKIPFMVLTEKMFNVFNDWGTKKQTEYLNEKWKLFLKLEKERAKTRK